MYHMLFLYILYIYICIGNLNLNAIFVSRILVAEDRIDFNEENEKGRD